MIQNDVIYLLKVNLTSQSLLPDTFLYIQDKILNTTLLIGNIKIVHVLNMFYNMAQIHQI